jgi:hypothetical protein
LFAFSQKWSAVTRVFGYQEALQSIDYLPKVGKCPGLLLPKLVPGFARIHVSLRLRAYPDKRTQVGLRLGDLSLTEKTG